MHVRLDLSNKEEFFDFVAILLATKMILIMSTSISISARAINACLYLLDTDDLNSHPYYTEQYLPILLQCDKSFQLIKISR